MRKLTDQQRKYAEARVRGENPTEAARTAGGFNGQAKVQGWRWERIEAVQEYMATLRRAAEALHEAETGEKPNGKLLQPEAIPRGNLSAVVDLADSLAVASNLVRATGGAKVTKEWREENATLGTVRVKREEDGGKALEMLIQHYDGKNAPKETSVVFNVNALVGLLEGNEPDRVDVVDVGKKLLGEGE